MRVPGSFFYLYLVLTKPLFYVIILSHFRAAQRRVERTCTRVSQQGYTMSKRNNILVAVSVVLTLVITYGIIAKWAGNRNTRQYESVVTGSQRSAEDMRGLQTNLVKFRKDFVPAFLPQHLWGQELCSAVVVTAVNFITGKPTLKDGPAWKFSRVNAGRIKEVYSRPFETDFKWKTLNDGSHQLTEVFDRPIWLSKVLPMVNGTTDRLYVVGYHYSLTQNDEKLWDARSDAGLNTHVMLLLGRYDGNLVRLPYVARQGRRQNVPVPDRIALG